MASEIAGWVAPIATMIAAMMTAANLGARVTGYGFIVFTIGSLAWILIGVSTGQTNLLASNAFLTLVNLIGIWRWLGRKARYEDGADAARARSRKAPGPNLFAATGIEGMRAVDAAGEPIGTAVEALLDCASGRIAYVVIASGGLAGARETLRAVPLADLRFAGDGLRFSGNAEAFEILEPIEGDDWPVRAPPSKEAD